MVYRAPGPKILREPIMSRRNSAAGHPHQGDQIRAQIAQTAARLMAEDGVSDFSLAKRKALRQLGLPESHPLPGNADIEEALKTYQAIYLADEQPAQLRVLREEAVKLMRLLAPFRPYLTGSVLDGTAGRYSDIDIQLYADSAKEVEIFLLNRGIDFAHETPRNERVDAVFVVENDNATAHLVVYGPDEERVSLKTRDGRHRDRARLEAVEALLAAG